MRRNVLFRTLLLSEFLVFLMFFSVGLYLFALSQSSKTDPDAVHGLQFSSAICLLISPLWLIPTLGIRLKKAWAWWMGLVVNLSVCLLSAWALGFGQPSVEWGSMVGPAIFLIVTIQHLLSRPTSWKAMELENNSALLIRS